MLEHCTPLLKKKMEPHMQQDEKSKDSAGNLFNRRISPWLVSVDYLVLILTALGLIAVAVLVLVEAFSEFLALQKYSVSHIVNSLMFVLIIMELFRQVFGQLSRHQFSLNPFLFIGIIASVRGILITQMKVAEREVALWDGLAQIAIYGVVVFVMVFSYYLSLKAEKCRTPPNE